MPELPAELVPVESEMPPDTPARPALSVRSDKEPELVCAE
jgi:hypothetical protein